MTLRSRLVMLVLAALSAAGACHARQEVQPFQPDTLGKIVSEAGTGLLVVVVWSLDCTYCLASLKVLAEAGAQENMAIAAIATDPFDDAEARQAVVEKLRQAGLTGPAWAFGSWPQARLRHAIDPAWRGEVPRSYWYRDGRRIASHSGSIRRETVLEYLSGRP